MELFLVEIGFYGKWIDIKMQEFSITVYELFPIVVAIEIWGQIYLIVPQCSSRTIWQLFTLLLRYSVVMSSIRRLVLACLEYNILLRAEHIPGKQNILPVLLSRLHVEIFSELAPHIDRYHTIIPPKHLHI